MDGANITLYGTSENQQDAVEVVGVLADETPFTAVVEPGEWVVVVYEDDALFNGGGVAVGLLEAEVQNGGSIELVMSKGGWVDVSTEFTSFNLQTYNAGTDDASSPVTVVVDVEVDLEMDVFGPYHWNPMVHSKSSSLLKQRHLIQNFNGSAHLTMNYTAGVSIDNGDEGRTAVMLSYNRKTTAI